VLFLVGNKPLFVAGPGSHIDRLITLAGGENAAYDSRGSYQMISMEVILSRQPEIIIDSSDNQANASRGRHLGSWAGFDTLPAVVRNQVYWIDPQQLSIPGPRLPEMAELMGKIIHPEIFGEPTQAELGPLRASGENGSGISP
jgi:iron complex transport system substrate-binding protein